MESDFIALLPLILCLCLIIVAAVAVVFSLKGVFKNANESFSRLKESASHFAGENSKTQGSHFLKFVWLVAGALVMFGLGRFIFFPAALLVALAAQAAAVYFITRKDKKKRSGKAQRVFCRSRFGIGGLCFGRACSAWRKRKSRKNFVSLRADGGPCGFYRAKGKPAESFEKRHGDKAD